MDRPTPKQAAEALRNVNQRSEQAVGSLRSAPRWLDVFFGVVIFLYCASADFLPGAAWPGLVLAALVVAYVVLIRTRRGAALLGQSTRVRREAISPAFARVARLVIGVIFVGSLATTVILSLTHTNAHVAYLSTILGAVLAVLLIAFGPQLRGGMVALAANGRRGSIPDGRR